jgi:hypothetical protein
MQLLVLYSKAGILAAGVQCNVASHMAVNINKGIKRFVYK